MRPGAFDYVAPASLDEALALLGEHGDEAKLLAGGQSLMPLMRLRLANPRLLIDINRLPGLDHVRAENGELRVGALVRHRQLETASLEPEWRILAAAARNVAHLPIRFRGTLGGSIAHADPAGELPLVARILDARMHLRSRRGDRVVAGEDFFQSFFTAALQPDEILTEVRIPSPPEGSKSSFLEFARRPGDFALAAAAVVVHTDAAGACDWCRIGLAGVAATPHRVASLERELLHHRLTDAHIDRSVETAMSSFEAGGDVHADARYRSQLSSVLLKRALREIARGRVAGHGGRESS